MIEYDNRFSCDGKQKYDSYYDAIGRQARLIKRNIDKKKRRPIKMRAYKCSHCGSFHIGHKRKDLRKARQR